MVDKAEETVDQTAVTQLSAALDRLVTEDKVDEKALEEVNKVVENLNDKTRAAIADLPVIQQIIEKRGASTALKPGEVSKDGLFSRKMPYTKRDVYSTWGVIESFTAPETIDVVTPGGWVFKLREGITYDVPLGTPMEKVPTDHGYQLPKIVVSILDDRRRAMRELKRETETKPFGQGVTFLQTGWAGKAQEIAASEASNHPAPTTE